MESKKNIQITAVRVELAVNICTLRPKVLEAVCSKKPTYIKSDDVPAYNVVKRLMMVEPSIGHILNFYYERMEQ